MGVTPDERFLKKNRGNRRMIHYIVILHLKPLIKLLTILTKTGITLENNG